MANQLTVYTETLINASTSKVWEVLVNPRYVAQWDELPEDYPKEHMTVGSKVVWNTPNGEQSITSISKADPEKELVIDLYGTSWTVKPREGEVAYHYKLVVNEGNQTLLKISIGDFSIIEDGHMYYDASVEFAEDAKTKIKELAESL
ncbi:uncharacterized protein YndB with AHSA1/START domain [Geomicrobium halophilum]|uniref:Uncharacterized protein YndB with AHSA1/START domain n=1 Tax=Geomicrobium halophilum TaxID=549000 RepID=A0A841PRK1_9BACL|nr:SRPBCC domain-containing protein [Geomicrobium halophilum]MBB6451409.1 uncharacterized protein YndB with AHSA1/START domain [Geomicrobium halophilum]